MWYIYGCEWNKTVSALAAGGGSNGIEVLFKSYASFTDCRSEINNTQIDNLVIPMYNLIDYGDN